MKIKICLFILIINFLISLCKLLQVLKSGLLSQRLLKVVLDIFLPSLLLSASPKHTLTFCSGSNQLCYVIQHLGALTYACL